MITAVKRMILREYDKKNGKTDRVFRKRNLGKGELYVINLPLDQHQNLQIATEGKIIVVGIQDIGIDLGTSTFCISERQGIV